MVSKTDPRVNRVEWSSLDDAAQIALAEQSLVKAAAIAADQAERLAAEMERGALADRGGADALRLLGAILRATRRDPWPREDPGRTQ